MKAEKLLGLGGSLKTWKKIQMKLTVETFGLRRQIRANLAARCDASRVVLFENKDGACGNT